MNDSHPQEHSSPIKSDLELLQGAWQQVIYEKDGMKEPLDEQGWEPKTIISGDTFTVILADGSIPIKGTFKLDSSHTPKTVAFTDTFGEDAGKTFSGIYSLDGDKFSFCVSDSGQEHPKEFKTMPGHVLRISRRAVP